MLDGSNSKNNLHMLSNIALSLIYSMFIFSISVLFTLNYRPIYYYDIDYLNIEKNSGISKTDIQQNYDAVIDYLSFFNKKPLEFPTLKMSDTGRIHFEEVKEIFTTVSYICIGTLIILIAGSIYKRKKDYLYLKLTSYFTLGIPLVLGILILLNWDGFFVIFHKILFRNDYWYFDVDTDPVITILPDTFFLHCAAMILFIILFSSVICYILCHYLTKRLKQKLI